MCLSSLLLWTCDQLYFRYIIDETVGYYIVGMIPKSSGWVHSVMVYHGTGSGITVYQDGIRVGTSTVKMDGSTVKRSGDGRVFIGKRVATGSQRYTSVLVDEVKMYNRQLSEDEICKLN